MIAYLGIQKAGAVLVPVSPIYTSHELEYMINNSEAKIIICMDTNFGYVKETFDKTCLEKAIVTNLVELLPIWKQTVGFLFDKVPKGKVKFSDQVVGFKSVLNNAPIEADISIDPVKDLSYILYTNKS